MRSRCAIVAAAFGLFCGTAAAIAQVSQPPRDFQQATRDEKAAYLKGALQRTANVEPRQLADFIQVALRDTDWSIRQLGLATVTARNVAPAIARGNANVRIEWESDRPELQRLRPLVVQALDDENEMVRREAVSALQSFDFDVKTAPLGRRLGQDTVAFLTARYHRETVPIVRAVIVDALGGTAQQDPSVRETLLVATRDAAPSVRQRALKGLMEFGPNVALPAAVAALQDGDAMVRREAAVQITMSGAAAKQYVPDIEAALLKGEPDAATRTALEGALQRLR